ncbi:ParA family protein [Lactiplantibacillus plantarum]|uniref:ParA family protein n=1 Tax=Lactiplantibacillus plantarum TaxID=1590 RepID=UPI0007BB69AE|nr:AAA family ATPase [Lactiplantibacillus plantarum]KZU55138.1 Chromosome partitioning protein ParA [Lactiplantibacillus plantarum]QIL58049.1 ParA family protein [Lactiplantibacillus plantarum]
MSESKPTKSIGKVISFINMKGGVGKTTLCREIGYTLNQEYNKSILFIDIDPQANLTQSLFEKYHLLPKDLYKELDDEEKSKTTICNNSINKLLIGNQILPQKNELIVHLNEGEAALDLIPGDLKTVFLERTNNGSLAENSLDKFIYKKELKTAYDYIFIDCPPTYSFYTTAAFNASDYYLVPVGIDPYSVLGIDLLEQVVKSIKDNNFRAFSTKTLNNMGIIFNPIAYTSNPTSERQLRQQKARISTSEKLQQYDLYYFREIFKYNSKYREQLDYFSIDINDSMHNANINAITTEFIDRLTFLDMEDKDNDRNK